MVLFAKLQKKILKYSVIIFEQFMADKHISTKVFLMTFHITQYLKDVSIYQMTSKLEMPLINIKTKYLLNLASWRRSGKVYLDCRDTSMLKSIIIKFWVTEIVPNEWNIGRLMVFLWERRFIAAKELQSNYVTWKSYMLILLFNLLLMSLNL